MTIIEEVILKKDTSFVSLNETLDTTTPWGKAMLKLLSSFCKMENEDLQIRTTKGRNAKVEKGGYAGGKPPLGYRALDGELVIVPDEAEIIRLVFELRGQGMTLKGIAEELNKRGYRTKKGGYFLHSSVQVILNNEQTYRGVYKYGKNNNIENQHEAILTDQASTMKQGD